MDAQTSLRLHGLRREILASRRRGRVIVEFDDGVPYTTAADARLIADQLISMVNLPMMGPHWVTVDRARTAEIITAVLHWDLQAFRQRVPEAEALELTERFLDESGGGDEFAIHLTNVRAGADLSQSPHRWASGSEQNELDAGVVVVSPKLVGMIWVEDRPAYRRD